MHNCRRTQNNFTDLIFGELPADQKQRFGREIEACDECARQYTSLIETLASFDEAANAALPKSEDYWLRYNERLRSRLDDSNAFQSPASDEAQRSASFWRRALHMRVQVPVPVLAAAVLIVAASLASLLLLKSPAAAARRRAEDSPANTRARSVSAPAVSNDSLLENPAKIIEAPVVQERIITRVVYLNRRQLPERKSNAARSNNRFVAGEPEQQKLARAAAGLPRAPLAQLRLDGFQPTNDVKLTVIKAAEKGQ